ncbi:hypothetical protein P3S34_10635 [Enterobacter hormaechei]|uniref:hypothetical protein n=1 Tax=Enterobacter cloacae complex TaxID=354276 RepID=UPI00076D9A0B|nr:MULTISPECIES: hypothetical protein [Enterobacter cloacae complex]VAC92154.1 Uncharacterised protein [Enterobacter cloacae]VAM16917.1 Uncharacterised protein [Enterobacter kobei]ELJ6237656.1 hypothetical protein [Enterobacter hormaechei]ELZ5042151.1 hypothetical protein [Enterobacter hormaechei]KVI49602.1 hypothetical protein AWS52_24455 [Enterobacter cloacae subsp. cloacae]
MSEYLLTWEYYDQDWKLREKGNFVMRVNKGDSFSDNLTGYTEAMAEARGAEKNRVVVSYCTKIN